jgi:hypothetical protein
LPGLTFNKFVPTATGTFLAPPIVSKQIGKIFFTTELAGTGVTTGNRDSIWSILTGGDANSASLIARESNPSPTGIVGQIIASLGMGSVNDSGMVHMTGTIAGTGVTSSNNSVIFTHNGSALQVAAQKGMPAFGLTDGALYSQFYETVMTSPTSGLGKLVFRSSLSGPGVNGTNNFAIGGSNISPSTGITPFINVRVGDYPHGITDGSRFMTLKSIVSSTGKSVYANSLFGANVTTANGHGIWTDRTGPVTLIARAGDQAPGVPAGVVFSTVYAGNDLPVVSSAGTSAFYGRLIGSGITWMNDTGIWSDRTGTTEKVFRAGDPVLDGYPAGIVFNSFTRSSTPMVIHPSGAITVSAMLRGSGISGGTNDRVLIRSEVNGTQTAIAKSNHQAPGLPDGVVFSAASLATIITVSNDAGDLFFSSGLAGAGVTSDNDRAMFAYQNGQLRAVLREGQVIDGWTVVNLHGDKLQINSQGQATFLVSAVYSGDSLGLSRTALISVNSNGVARVVAGENTPLAMSNAPTATVNILSVSDTNALDDLGNIVFSVKFVNSATEAIVSASIDEQSTTCPADFDGSGTADVSDIFSFLNSWFAGNSSADFDNNGALQVQDIFAFLGAWFEGC